MRMAGIPVKIENWGGKMHEKSLIIDDKYLLIGSMNFTSGAHYQNDENSLLIENKEIAIKSRKRFENYGNQYLINGCILFQNLKEKILNILVLTILTMIMMD